jgi:hypothetical protein
LLSAFLPEDLCSSQSQQDGVGARKRELIYYYLAKLAGDSWKCYACHRQAAALAISSVSESAFFVSSNDVVAIGRYGLRKHQRRMKPGGDPFIGKKGSSAAALLSFHRTQTLRPFAGFVTFFILELQGRKM